MNKRWVGFGLWLLLAGCLYFFENNTGTRVILICSVLFPLLPPLRAAFFSPDAPVPAAHTPGTVDSLAGQQTEEPGEVRQYQPGDPLNRIHWKLSAKREELLVRGGEIREQEASAPRVLEQSARRQGTRLGWIFAAMLLLCLLLLLLFPQANRSFQALCNRLFAASERVNAYAYAYFPVPEGQGTAAAAALLALALICLVGLAVLLRSRGMALGLMAACTLTQVYFGVALPTWLQLLLWALLALWMVRRPVKRNQALRVLLAVLLTAWAVALLFPGVDGAVEKASEAVRDRLSQMAQQMTDRLPEGAAGDREVRRVHTRSLEEGDDLAQTDREYRLVTEEKEQLSIPRWIDYLKIALLLLLTAAVVAGPFFPFVILNMRQRKARARREAFASPLVSEAVCAIFQQVILWLRETGHGRGNRLYRQWAETLPETMPTGYSRRFLQCAQDFEEAAYSCHVLGEEKRTRALALLKETEAALWKAAGWKQRLRLKYWMCLWE